MEKLSPRALRERLEASAGAVVRQSPWDRRALPVLIASTLLLVFDAAYIAATDLSFHTSTVLKVFGLLIWLLMASLLARTYAMTRIGDLLLGITLPLIFSALIVVLTVILTRHSGPFADAWISGSDQALGLDWVRLLSFYKAQPEFTAVSQLSYNSLKWQLPLVCFALFLSMRWQRGWTLVNAWALALIVAAAIHPFFTAMGPYLHYGISPYDFPAQRMPFPWTTGPTLEAIRTHRNTDVVGLMNGLVFFPSFHTAAGVMFIYSWWDFRRLRWLFVPLNLLMISACPIIGYHYFSDVIAGACVGTCAILIARWLVRRIGAPEPIGARQPPG
jgi:membrane-associated phospholipid phosphatase